MVNVKNVFRFSVVGIMLVMLAVPVVADEAVLRPFVLGSSGPGTIDAQLGEIKTALTREGFQVAGEYAPYKGAYVVVVTSEPLRNSAAKSDFGAYGAIERVSLTETGTGLQVAYTNPLYFAQAYLMKDPLAEVAASLEKALGKKAEFGSKNGITASKLRAYHYMMMMPYFTDQVKLASYKSQDEALQAVEAGLAAHKGGTSKVYRVDEQGNKESVFGVGLSEGDGADAAIMKVIDTGDMKHTAHLPYELVVSGGKVFMLHGKFRIALDFPDLGMGTFMKISGAPGAIEDKLKRAAGGQ